MSIADQVIDATRSPDFLATEMPAGIRVPRCSSPDPCAARQNMIDNGDMTEEYSVGWWCYLVLVLQCLRRLAMVVVWQLGLGSFRGVHGAAFLNPLRTRDTLRSRGLNEGVSHRALRSPMALLTRLVPTNVAR